jgi:predicted RecB family nuclease
MPDGVAITAGDVEAWLRCRRIPYLRASKVHPSHVALYGQYMAELQRTQRFAHGEKNGVEVWIDRSRGDFVRAAAETRTAMDRGARFIGTPALLSSDHGPQLLSAPDFLVRDNGGYTPREVTLAKSLRIPEHAYRLGFHCEVLHRVTGQPRRPGTIALGDGSVRIVPLDPAKELPRVIEEIRAARQTPDWPEVAYSHHRCGPCRFLPACMERFQAARDISLVYDLTTTAWGSLREKGLRTYDDLAASDPATLGKVRGFASRRLPRAIAQARVLVSRQSRLLAPPELPAAAIFLDLEGDPEGKVDYLWGVLDGGSYIPLVARGAEGDRQVFAEFLELCSRVLGRNPATRIVHYGTYEQMQFQSYAKRYGGRRDLIDAVNGAFFDLHKEVRRTLVAPVTSYGLKALAHCFGFSWRVAGSSASWSIARYHAWRDNNDEKALEEIERYNEDDVRATELVFNKLRDGVSEK